MRILFVNSHLASGSTELVEILNENDRIQVIESNIVYESIDDIGTLKTLKHKFNSPAAIYGDHLLFNTSFLNKSIYQCAKFIYFIRPAISTLNELINKYHYTPTNALSYYCLRVRRLYEMAHQTPGAVFLTWNNIADSKGLGLIEKYLELKQPLRYGSFSSITEEAVPFSLIKEAEDYYEKYFYLFRQLDLRMVDSQQKVPKVSTATE